MEGSVEEGMGRGSSAEVTEVIRRGRGKERRAAEQISGGCSAANRARGGAIIVWGTKMLTEM